MKQLIIATRGSALALWQANHIKAMIERRHGITVALNVIRTKGDVIQDVPLSKVGGKGLFVKEIESALLDGSADLAVHSMKDVPMELPEGLVLGAVPGREDPSDMLLSMRYPTLRDLPPGARVGTSSLRRQAQLLALRPDLDVVSLRGNVDTRLRKLRDGEFAAIVMASAGIRRLGLSAPCASPLTPPDFLPAVGQGALGIECRADDASVLAAVAFLEDPDTRLQVEAERGFSARLDGGCQAPIAAMAYGRPDGLHVDGLVASLDGGRVLRGSVVGDAGRPREAGIRLAERLLADGGAAILAQILRHDVP